MRVTMNGLTKAGGQVFEADATYDVDDALGQRMLAAGWARDPDAAAPTPGVPGTTPGARGDQAITDYDRAEHGVGGDEVDVQPDDSVEGQVSG